MKRIVLRLLALASLTGCSFRGGRFGWLQPTISPIGRQIDDLYMVILWIIVALFLITQGVLVVSVFAFRERPGRKAAGFHNNLLLEIVWTAIPAAILAMLVFLSGGLWRRARQDFPRGKDVVLVQVMAEQFSWNFRYAGKDGIFGTADDVLTVNELHVPVNRDVLLLLSSRDVVHSLSFPEGRIKQDAVPGLLGRTWFKLDRLCVWNLAEGRRYYITEDEFNARPVAVDGFDLTDQKVSLNGLRYYQYVPSAGANGQTTFLQNGGLSKGPASQAQWIFDPLEIGCSQLCGTLHFAMRGQVYVQTPDQFGAWLASAPVNETALRLKWTQSWDQPYPDFNKPQPELLENNPPSKGSR